MRIALLIAIPLLLASLWTWPLFNWRTLLPLVLLACVSCATHPSPTLQPLPVFPPVIEEEEPFTPPRLKQRQYEVLELVQHTRRTAPRDGDVHQGRVPQNDGAGYFQTVAMIHERKAGVA